VKDILKNVIQEDSKNLKLKPIMDESEKKKIGASYFDIKLTLAMMKL